DHLSSAIQSVGAADTESEDEFDRCLAKQQKSSRRPSRRFKFADRQKADTEFSPVFHQFLDCVFQLWLQYPDRFEFNEEYLLDIHYHIYSCQFGTFIGNSQRERQEWDLPANTISIWPWLHQRQGRYLNDLWNGRRARCDTEDMIHPDSRHVQFWTTLFKQERESVGENLFNVCKSRKADSGDISSSSSSNSSSPSPQNDAGENQEGGNADKLVISDGDQSPEVISVPSSSVGTNLSNDVEYSEGSSLEREFGSVYIDRHHVKGPDGELSVPKKTTSTSEWDALSLNPWTDLDPRSHPEEGTQADTAAAAATAAAIIDAGGDSALRRSVFLRSDPLRSALAGAQSENISPVLASTLPPISTKNTAPCSAKPFFADEEEAN
ncbi:phosphatidylinositol-3-phosphatase ymr1, partial [Spiromyces aspiralis]